MESRQVSLNSTPNRLSGLIRLAVECARGLDRDNYFLEPRYDHDGFRKHSAFQQVRLGLLGAFMAGALGVKSNERVGMHHFQPEIAKLLYALLYVERFDVENALNIFGLGVDEYVGYMANRVGLERHADADRWAAAIADSPRLAAFAGKPASACAYVDWRTFDRFLIWLDGLAEELDRLGL